MNTTLLPGILMGILALISLAIVLIYFRKAVRRSRQNLAVQKRLLRASLFIPAIWLILIGVLAANGYFSQFQSLPPRPVLFMMLPLPFVLLFAFSTMFKKLAMVIPPHWFVIFQSFRIFVELLLFQGFINGLLPVQMTFEGRNWDIIAGLGGAVLGYFMMRKKAGYNAAILYNIIGIALLLNVLVVAFLSMPGPFRYFMNEPSLEKVGTFPMIYLPTVLVVLAYSSHIFSLRQLWLLKKAESPVRKEQKAVSEQFEINAGHSL